jgi:hypothetical protein
LFLLGFVSFEIDLNSTVFGTQNQGFPTKLLKNLHKHFLKTSLLDSEGCLESIKRTYQ